MTQSTRILPAASVRRDLYYWRFVSTALGFTLFGIGGALLGVVVVPLLLVLPGGRIARQARVRRMIRLAFRSFVGFMHRTGTISYSIVGAERLGQPGQLIIANHPTLIDIVLLIAFVPGAGCVVKRAAWRNPAMAIGVRAAGYVPNEPTDRMIDGAAARLADGECLIMFPEGTRTVPDRPAHFHRGAASVALRAARVVTPVYIRVKPGFLSKVEPWHRIPSSRPHLTLRVGHDIDPAGFRAPSMPLASRAFNEHLIANYTHEATAD